MAARRPATQTSYSPSSSAFPSCISGVHTNVLLFFFFCVPQLYLWGSPFWVRFLRMWPSFNPTIEVVTFRLRGWCMLGVFLLPAFIRPGSECQDLLSPCDGMHVCRLDLGLYSHPKEFWANGVTTHVNSKGKFPSTGKNSPQRRIEPAALYQAGQRAQHTNQGASYPGPERSYKWLLVTLAFVCPCP